MKSTLFLIALLASIQLAHATDETLMHIKVSYQSAHDNKDNREVEVDALTGRSSVVLPLTLSTGKIWSFSLDPDESGNIVSANVEELSVVGGKEPEKWTWIPLLSLRVPYQNGVDLPLLKGSGFTLVVNISPVVPAASAVAPPATPTDVAPAQFLTAEEIARMELSFRAPVGYREVEIFGHNPFSQTLTGGILRVVVPKTETTPEINREYQLDFTAPPLNDLYTVLQWNLELVAGQKPTYTLEKLQFSRQPSVRVR